MQLHRKNTPTVWSCYDALTCGIVVHRQGKLLYINPAAVEITGLSLEQMQRVIEGNEPGWSVLDQNGLSDPVVPSEMNAQIGTAFLYGSNVVFGLLQTGAERPQWFLSSSQPLNHPEHEHGIIVATCVNITHRIQTEGRLRRMNRSLTVLNEFNHALVNIGNEKKLLAEICRVMVETAGYGLAWFGYETGGLERSVVAVGMQGTILSGENLAGGEGCAVTTWNGAEASESLAAMADSYAHSQELVLAADGQPIGALHIYADRAETFDGEELRLLNQIADDLAQRVVALRFRAERKKAEESLKLTQFALDHATDAVFWLDSAGRFLYTNYAACTLFEYEPDLIDVLTAMDITQIYPAQSWPEQWKRIKEQGSITAEVIHRTSSGREVLLEITGNYMEFNGKEYCFAFARDITERKQVEDALRESEEKYRNLVECSNDWVWEIDRDNVYTYASPRIYEMLGLTPEEVLGKTPFDLMTIESRLQTFEAFSSAKVNLTPFSLLENHLRHKDGRRVVVETSGAPIFDKERLFQGYRGIDRDITERKRAEHELTLSLDKLHRSIEGVVESMALTVEMKDPYTAGHQRRVSQLACAIAREMGLSDNRIDGIRLASLVHDIGKIYVPAEILSKPGRINEIEFSLIKTHPTVGYDVLKSIEFPWPIAQMVVQHHERINGAGYPFGLKSEDILLEAKIISVADVVEAMSSHRPYRPALGIEEALAEIRNNSGFCYEPDVVEACLRVFDEGFTFQYQDNEGLRMLKNA